MAWERQEGKRKESWENLKEQGLDPWSDTKKEEEQNENKGIDDERVGGIQGGQGRPLAHARVDERQVGPRRCESRLTPLRADPIPKTIDLRVAGSKGARESLGSDQRGSV